MTDYYRINHVQKEDRKRPRRRWLWLILLLLLLISFVIIGLYIRNMLKPEKTITQSKAITKKVVYESKTKHYVEDNFTIDIANAWHEAPPQPSIYKIYTWEVSEKGTNGQQIQIYEDTIPETFAVNKLLVVEGGLEQLQISGSASDNCIKYTKGSPAVNGRTAVPARWQGIDFICDTASSQRDVIGTGSDDGINMVIMKSPVQGTTHKYFFTHTDHRVSPDYTDFYDALRSFRMQ